MTIAVDMGRKATKKQTNKQTNNHFWGFQKNKYFLGYEDFVDIFLGSSQNGLYLGVISMHFRVFFGWTVDTGPEPTYEEKITSTPPPPPLGYPLGKL